MKNALSIVLIILLVFPAFQILTISPVSSAVDEYFIYSRFDPSGIGDVTAAGGYVEYYGVPEWGDEIQYVYFLSGTTGYRVRVTVTDGDGDGKIEPRQHPSHYLAGFVGAIEPRHFEIVSSADLDGHTSGSSGHTEEFYVDSSGVYLGAYPYGINKWDHDWNYVGKIASSPPERCESMAYNPAENIWYAGGRDRTVYQLKDTDGDGSFLDESWQAVFTYPNYSGDHHDGMEYVGGYLWISDMTSDVIGKWQYNPTTNTWQELARFTYTEPADVEGMGFGPNDHFWVGSGWGSGSYLYELGNEITRGYPIADAGDDVLNYPPTMPIKFDASESHHTDPAKQIVLYEWDFESDGTWDYSGTDLTAEHAYPAYYDPGGSIDWSKTAKDYTATLRVTDNSDPPLQDTDTCIVHITAPPWKPVADPDGPYETYKGIPIQLDGSKSYDPESKMYASNHPWYETIATYEWDLDNDGQFDDAVGVNPTYAWNGEGLYIIALKVTDSQPSGPGGTVGTLDVDAKFTTVVIKGIRVARVATIFAEFSPNTPAPTLFNYDDFKTDIADYYGEVSYSAILVDLEPYGLGSQDWTYSVPHDHDYYGAGRGDNAWDSLRGLNKEKDFAWDAIVAADKDIDYDNFDIVVVVHAGFGEEQNVQQSDMWSQFFAESRKTSSNNDNDADVARNWIVVAEQNPVGVWTHELGHALGQVLVGKTLPDRYINGWIGNWGLMCAGGWVSPPTHLCSYSKNFLNWLTYKEISYGTYWINSLETMKLNDQVSIFKYKKVWYEIPNYYIIEARTNLYGDFSDAIPYDSAVLLYNVDVRLLQPDTVNLLPANVYWKGAQVVTTKGGSYSDPDAQVSFKFVDSRTDANKLETSVSVERFTAKRLKGASITPAASVLGALQSILNVPPQTIPSLPDIDLHAYTTEGKHVGTNYATGEYEMQIPDAIASGDLLNGREWIFVPDDVEVQFVVSSKDIQKFLGLYPDAINLTNGTEAFVLSLVYYDSDGNRWESAPPTRQIDSGRTLWFTPIIVDNLDGTYTTELAPDIAPPTTTVLVGEPKYIADRIYLTNNTLVTLEATDTPSGINSTIYRICNTTYDSDWKVYTSPFSLSDLTDGEYTVNYRSDDNSGNCEPYRNQSLYLDTSPPNTSLAAGYPQYASGVTYVTQGTTFTLDAIDAGSGVQSMFYRVEGQGSDYLRYQSPFSLVSLSDGNYTITYFSVDRLNNTEATKSMFVFVDSTAPVTTCSPREGDYSQSMTVSLSVTDVGSGANETFYKIGQGTWIRYTGEFNITSSGQYNISFYSVDQLGNAEQPWSLKYVISAPWNPGLLLAAVLAIVLLITVPALVLSVKRKPRPSAKTTLYGSKGPAIKACPTCGHVLSYAEQYKRWYCSRCRKFVD